MGQFESQEETWRGSEGVGGKKRVVKRREGRCREEKGVRGCEREDVRGLGDLEKGLKVQKKGRDY